MRSDQLARYFYERITEDESHKSIGAPVPLEDFVGTYVNIRLGDTQNLNDEEGGTNASGGGINMTGDGVFDESWFVAAVELDIIVVEERGYDITDTYKTISEAAERLTGEVRNMRLDAVDSNIIDWWISEYSAIDVGEGEAQQMVVKQTLTVTVKWRDQWYRPI